MSRGKRISGERADETRAPGRPQSEELDRAILDAALERLSEVGFEALSIAAVARRAQTTTPAIYRRYRDKTKLLLAALEQDLASLAGMGTDHGSLRADLKWWVRSIFDALSPHRTRILASLSFQARTDREPLELLSGTIHRFGSSQWSAIIRRAVQRGELNHSDVPEVIGKLPGALAMHFALLRDFPQDDRSIAEFVEVVMLPVLLAAAAPAGAAQTPLNPK